MAPPGEVVIRTVDLRVDYGDVTAVSGLHLEIPRGAIFGLIGPNGAGKTSTMKVLATLLQPTYGEVTVGGMDVLEDPRGVHRLLGYMPDWAPVDPDLRVWEFLELFAGAYGLPPNRRRVAVDEAIQLAELGPKARQPAGSLSRGMKQRLVLAKTLLHSPAVLVLDEPASGLDPRARVELRKVLKGIAGEGRTVMVSSHILTEMEHLCTSLGIMERGRMVATGTLKEIVARVAAHRTLRVEVIGETTRAREVLEASASVKAVGEGEDGALEVAFDGDDGAMSALHTRLVRADVAVMSFAEQPLGVEDVFMAIGARETA